MAQSTPTAEEKAAEQREAERRAAEKRRDAAAAASTPAPAPETAPVDVNEHDNDVAVPEPPNDDGKSMIEKAKEGVVPEEQPVPTQAELDEQRERVLGGGSQVEVENREMQPKSDSAGNYPTR